MGVGVLEQLHDVDGLARGFGDDLAQVLAQPVMGHAALHDDAGLGDVGEPVGVVGLGVDRFTQVAPDLAGVDVDCGREVDVAHVVATQVDVHQTWNEFVVLGVAVEVDPLDEG